MTVITLRDYAKNNNISYEAVRQQVVRYKDELGEHIIRDGRQQFLDEEAVAFLDSKRQKNPVAIIQMDKDEQIEALRRDKETILTQLASVQAELLEEKKKTSALLEEQREKIALLEADNKAAEDARLEAEAKAAATSDELVDLREDHNSLIERNKMTEDNLQTAQARYQELQRAWQEYWALPLIKRIFAKKPEMPGE